MRTIAPRRRFRPLLATLVVLAACGRPAADSALRVMSFNIRYGTAEDGDDSWPLRAVFVAEVIDSVAPDVLGLQEALRFQLDELETALPGYGEIGVGRDDGRGAGEYAAILYRRDRLAVRDSGTFWFSDTPSVPGSVSWGNHVTRICTWARLEDRRTGRRFSVYNVHLDHESQESRERSAQLLAARMAERPASEPAIVLGDFNAGADNPARQFLSGAADPPSAGGKPAPPRLIDTFAALHPDATADGTFNAFRGDSTGPRIDAILVSGEWATLQADIVRSRRGTRYPSDHFPITALLDLGPHR
jgi:endonuclease/exonuclease/phosphatase family metal-dependent hydrolase